MRENNERFFRRLISLPSFLSLSLSLSLSLFFFCNKCRATSNHPRVTHRSSHFYWRAMRSPTIRANGLVGRSISNCRTCDVKVLLVACTSLILLSDLSFREDLNSRKISLNTPGFIYSTALCHSSIVRNGFIFYLSVQFPIDGH